MKFIKRKKTLIKNPNLYLKNTSLQKANQLYSNTNWKLLQDNSPYHKTDYVLDFLDSKGVKRIEHHIYYFMFQGNILMIV